MNGKIKKSVLVGLVLTLSPLTANADIIRFNYTGTVFDVLGTGFGYTVGGTITGWFEFDTDDADEWFDGSGWGYGPVDSNTGDGGFPIKEDYFDVCDAATCGADWLLLVDGSFNFGYEPLFDDQGNVVGEVGFEEYFYHYLDFFDDPWGDPDYGSIEQFGWSYECDADWNCEYFDEYYDAAFFMVDSVVRVVPVSEPGAIALLGIGLLGMGAARRKKV